MIMEISAFSIPDLLDNGFWWQDSMSRKIGERYKRKSGEQRGNTDQPKHQKIDSSLYFWLPDYVYWAPVVRMAKWDRTLIWQLWYAHIHRRLFLPLKFWDNKLLVDEEEFDLQLALRLLFSLGRCMEAYYGAVEDATRNYRDNLTNFLWFLTRTTIPTDTSIGQHRIRRLLEFATQSPQLVD